MRLLLVEDNQELSELMIRGFEQSGLAADAVATLDEARIVLQTRYYDALVLDLGLPDGDALSLVSELKAAKSQIPIIILTARDGIGDRVKGLRAGADDYLVKPFAIEELNARLEALMRRFPGGPSQSLKLGNVELVVEQDSGSVLIDGQLRIFSPRDVQILEMLLQRKGRVVSKDFMAGALKGSGVTHNAIEVYIHRLRKSLEDRGASVYLETVKGVGYIIVEKS